jgi:hypothetical protein
MAILSNRQLWEMGERLNDAWLEFASEGAKGRISELPTFVDAVRATDHKTLAEFAKGISAGVSAKLAREKAEAQLREALLVELFNDELHAYAYRVAPTRSRSPVRIAAELFNLHDPDWQKESLSARGMEYGEIRIVDPARIARSQLPSAGRKGSADAIRKAIADLQREGVDLCGPRKQACQLVRNKLGYENIKGSGLSDPNLAKYILEICNKRSIGN